MPANSFIQTQLNDWLVYLVGHVYYSPVRAPAFYFLFIDGYRDVKRNSTNEIKSVLETIYKPHMKYIGNAN